MVLKYKLQDVEKV